MLLCTGHHTKPYFPGKWPGQDEFQGKISHAHSYKDHRGYEDKKVVVVGIGNSGVDIAVELSRIAEQVRCTTAYYEAQMGSRRTFQRDEALGCTTALSSMVCRMTLSSSHVTSGP